VHCTENFQLDPRLFTSPQRSLIRQGRFNGYT
jgi:hypothetical protein